MKILFFFFSLIICITPLNGGVVQEGLKQIPEQEILLMNEFVKINFEWNQTAHVIFFNNKPCSLATAFYKSTDIFLRDQLWIKGWEAFKKYEYLFPHPNFIFVTHLYEEDEYGYQPIELFIINKSTLAKCINQYKPIFQDVIGEQFSYEWFISELERKKTIEEIIKDDQVLLGILLGYGEVAAKDFDNHQKQRLEYYFLREDVYCGNSPPIPEKCRCFPVVFMGNPQSKDVQELVSVYGKELEIFWSKYQKKNPLVFFLEGICAEEADVLQNTFRPQRNEKFNIFNLWMS